MKLLGESHGYQDATIKQMGLQNFKKQRLLIKQKEVREKLMNWD